MGIAFWYENCVSQVLGRYSLNILELPVFFIFYTYMYREKAKYSYVH